MIKKMEADLIELENRYRNQAQTGAGFRGLRYQTGEGWFGDIFKKLAPALKYIGRQGWEGLKAMSKGVISGESLGDAARSSLINTTQNVLSDATTKLEKFKRLKKQAGSGMKKRKVKKQAGAGRRKVKKQVGAGRRKVKGKSKKKSSKIKKKPKIKKKVYKKRGKSKKKKKPEYNFL